MNFACPHCTDTEIHTIEKYCPKCAKTLPHLAFNRDKRMADGLYQWCVPCRKIYRVLERQRLRERLETDSVFAKQWHARHADHQAKWFAKNTDKAHASANAYAAANKEKINTRRRKRYAEDPSKPLANNRKRRARKRGAATSTLTAAQWQAIKEHYGHRCVYCGRKMQRLTQDHITPLAKGGSHTVSNVVPACTSCNCRKRHGPVLKPIQPLLIL